MIDATDLFNRTDRAFTSLRDLAAKAMERNGVTPEWARLHAKGTAVANANEVFKQKLVDIDDSSVKLHYALTDIQNTLDALITAAEDEITEVKDGKADKVTEFRNAIADGHVDGYKVARDYLTQEVQYFYTA